MKRKIQLILVGIVVAVAAIYSSLFALNTQGSIAPVRPDTVIASLPVLSSQPFLVEIDKGVTFKFDTGSDYSCITQADLDTLRTRGAKITERIIPTVGRNVFGRYNLAWKRYVIDLPLHFYVTSDDPDSVGVYHHEPSRDNVLRNAEFILVDGSESSIGIDLMRHFAVEYLYEKQLMRFHSGRPEGYQDFAVLRTSHNPAKTPWPGRRYYMELQVDHITDQYFLDTGLRKAALKLPNSRGEKTRRRTYHDSLVSSFGVFPARTDDVWVQCGNRAGSQLAFYCENNEEPYSVNPLNFFTQDILLDFTTSSIALRPFVTLPKRHFEGRAEARDSI